MSYETISLVIDKRGVATLCLERPDKHNALNAQMIAELRDAAAIINAASDIRVVVLTGNGRSFCAGGDVNWFAENIERDRNGRIAESSTLADMLADLDQLQKPLIGKINGAAYGGGVGMISVCDIAVGVERSKFGLTEVRLGLLPANISPYVVARIGVNNSRATMLSGALFSATHAQSIGLLNHVVDEATIDAAIEAIVQDHLQAAPEAVAATKKLIRYVASHAMQDNMIYTADRLADAWETEEGKTGIDCFLNRTTPPWRTNE